jgi:secreted trypsin-like serine protease
VQTIEVQVLDDEWCSEETDSFDGDSALCAGDPGQAVGTCHGDGGSPLICTNEAKEPVLIGITTSHNFCDKRSGIYTEVSKFINWIDEVTDESSNHVGIGTFGQCNGNFITGRVYGGEEATPHSHPYIVNIGPSQFRRNCGGTLISPEWILTAAHCLPSGFARIGYHQMFEPTDLSVTRKILQTIPHPNFKMREVVGGPVGAIDKMEFDVALLRIAPVELNEKIHIACLPEIDHVERPGTECVIAGWGGTDNPLGANGQPPLLEAELDILADRECARFGEVFHNPSAMCAGRPNEGISTCGGDSGGPLICKGNNNEPVLIGITSAGGGCGPEGVYPSVYAEVSKIVQWIKDELLDSNTAEPPQTTDPKPDANQLPSGLSCPSNIFSPERLFGGSDASDNTWQFLVSLQWNNGHRCGGTILNEEWILTAAHCVTKCIETPLGFNEKCEPIPEDQLSIMAGVSRQNDKRKAQNRDVLVRHIHPDYNQMKGLTDDIALLKIEKLDLTDNNVQIVCLPDHDESPASEDCFIGGWGVMDLGLPLQVADHRQSNDQKIISDSECFQMMSKVEPNGAQYALDLAPEKEICTTRTDDNTNACFGDSGGPLVCVVKDDNGVSYARQYGVASWVSSRACDQPSVYAELQEYMPYIKNIITGDDIEEEPTDSPTDKPSTDKPTDTTDENTTSEWSTGTPTTPWFEFSSNYPQVGACPGCDGRSDCPCDFGQCKANFLSDKNAAGGRIFGGTEVERNSFPFIVSLRNMDWGAQKLEHNCGGSILSDEWILTAAHCLPGLHSVFIGHHHVDEQDSTSQERRVIQIVEHPEYHIVTDLDGRSLIELKNDIALVKVEKMNLDRVHADFVCLPNQSPVSVAPPIGKRCFAAGWGRSETESPASKLLAIDIDIVEDMYCRHSSYDYDGALCAGNPGDGKGICGGDSGGPLVCTNGDNEPVLTGLTSAGGLCGETYGVFTEVSKYIDWIRRTTGNTNDDQDDEQNDTSDTDQLPVGLSCPSNLVSSGRLFGGSDAENRWPFIVSLQLAGNGGHRCGGTILNDEWILTAAHCVTQCKEKYNGQAYEWCRLFEPYELRVAASITNLKDSYDDEKAQFLRVLKIVVHRNFNMTKGKLEDDVALMKIEKIDMSDQDVGITCLPNKGELPKSENCFIAGWGLNEADDNGTPVRTAPEKLQSNNQVVLGDRSCYNTLANQEPNYSTSFRPKKEICTTTNDGSKNACMGDSGGPLVCVVKDDNENSVARQYGIASWVASKQCAQPSVYAEVSNYIAFIEHVILGTDNEYSQGGNQDPTDKPVETTVYEPYTYTTTFGEWGEPLDCPWCTGRGLCPCDLQLCEGNLVADKESYKSSERLIGGESARADLQFIASLRKKNRKHLCAGTILSKSWILTAAHCVENGNLEYAYVGSRHLDASFDDDKAHWRKVLNYTIHPEYSGQEAAKIKNDIALVEVDEMNLWVHPDHTALSPINDKWVSDYACLPEHTEIKDAPPYTSECFVAGWGSNSDTGPLSNDVQTIEVKVLKDSWCSEETDSFDADSALCAGDPGEPVGTCRGDGGGPLICTNEWKEPVLIGITTSHNFCDKRSGIYTEVSKFIKWIDQITEMSKFLNLNEPLTSTVLYFNSKA